MSLPRHAPSVAQYPPGRCAGGMAIEAVLGLLILVLAAWLVADLGSRLAHRRRCDRYVADLHAFAAAWQQYLQQPGADPAAVGPDGSPPAALAGALAAAGWSRASPFGGKYELVRLDLPGARGRLAVAVTAFAPRAPLTMSRADLLRVDARIDDGNPATGRFRAGYNGWPVFFLDGN